MSNRPSHIPDSGGLDPLTGKRYLADYPWPVDVYNAVGDAVDWTKERTAALGNFILDLPSNINKEAQAKVAEVPDYNTLGFAKSRTGAGVPVYEPTKQPWATGAMTGHRPPGLMMPPPSTDSNVPSAHPIDPAPRNVTFGGGDDVVDIQNGQVSPMEMPAEPALKPYTAQELIDATVDPMALKDGSWRMEDWIAAKEIMGIMNLTRQQGVKHERGIYDTKLGAIPNFMAQQTAALKAPSDIAQNEAAENLANTRAEVLSAQYGWDIEETKAKIKKLGLEADKIALMAPAEYAQMVADVNLKQAKTETEKATLPHTLANLQANTENLRAQTESETALLDPKINKMLSDTEHNKAQTKRIDALLDLDVKKMKGQIKNLNAETENVLAQTPLRVKKLQTQIALDQAMTKTETRKAAKDLKAHALNVQNLAAKYHQLSVAAITEAEKLDYAAKAEALSQELLLITKSPYIPEGDDTWGGLVSGDPAVPATYETRSLYSPGSGALNPPPTK